MTKIKKDKLMKIFVGLMFVAGLAFGAKLTKDSKLKNDPDYQKLVQICVDAGKKKPECESVTAKQFKELKKVFLKK